MPNISEYEAPQNLDLRPSETGIEATARAAQRINMYGSQEAQDLQRTGEQIGRGIGQIGEAVDQYVTHQQISAGGKHGTEASAGIEQQWNNLLKSPGFDPNDPSTAAKFREEVVEPALEDFQKGFTTPHSEQWAQEFSEHFRQHMQTKTDADMSTQAGIAVRTNAVETINNLSTTTFNDPSSLNFAKDALAHTLQGKVSTSPNISAEDAAKVTQDLTLKGEESLVKSAIQGAIMKGGNWQSIANDPKNEPYINAAETQQFLRQEKQYQTSMRIAGNQERIQQKQIAEDNAHSSINQSWSQNVQFDPASGHVNINPQFIHDMAQLPTRNPNAPDAVEKARTYIDWAESQQKPPPVHDNPQVVDDLLRTASDPTKTLDDVKIATAKADIAKGITPQTRAQVSQLAQDMRNINDPFVKNALDLAKTQIEPSIPGVKVEANAAKYASFYYNFIHNIYLPAKVAGTLPPNALDVGDPKSMISQAIAAVPGNGHASIGGNVSTNGGVGSGNAPAPPISGAAPKSEQVISGKAEYDALQSGASFTMNGKKYVKP